jgi:hypothetical protein
MARLGGLRNRGSTKRRPLKRKVPPSGVEGGTQMLEPFGLSTSVGEIDGRDLAALHALRDADLNLLAFLQIRKAGAL